LEQTKVEDFSLTNLTKQHFLLVVPSLCPSSECIVSASPGVANAIKAQLGWTEWPQVMTIAGAQALADRFPYKNKQYREDFKSGPWLGGFFISAPEEPQTAEAGWYWTGRYLVQLNHGQAFPEAWNGLYLRLKDDWIRKVFIDIIMYRAKSSVQEVVKDTAWHQYLKQAIVDSEWEERFHDKICLASTIDLAEWFPYLVKEFDIMWLPSGITQYDTEKVAKVYEL
jgi:hypothetical protein